MNDSNARVKTPRLKLSTQKMRNLTPQETSGFPDVDLIAKSDQCPTPTTTEDTPDA